MSAAAGGRTWATGSTDVPDFVLRPGGPQVSAEARLIYLALFSYMGMEGTCHPKTETIAEGCGLSVRTIQRYLPELEAAGLVETDRAERAKRGAVRREATVYQLFPPWSPTKVEKGDSVTPIHKGRQTDTLSKGDKQTPINTKGCQADA